MGDFFKPWRRRIGVVTLMMACAITSLWIRSRGIVHTCAIPLPADRAFVVATLNGRIGCGVQDWVSPPLFDVRKGTSEESLLNRTLEEVFYLPYTIPCWTIAIPLIMLSAWLLLSKPRTPTQKPVEPTATNGA